MLSRLYLNKPVNRKAFTSVKYFHLSAYLLNGKNKSPAAIEEIIASDLKFDPKSGVIFTNNLQAEIFGQLVDESENLDNLKNLRVISQEDALTGIDPKLRDPDTGKVRKGENGQETRLHDETRWGKINHKQIYIPENLTKVIKNNMLFQYDPKILKSNVAEWYADLNANGVLSKAKSELDSDVIIAGGFAQHYAMAYQVLDEMIKRIGKEKVNSIESVLDIGNGPGVGMLALNELMGADWNPKRKDVVVRGDYSMARRAKILLSRQENEYWPRSNEVKDDHTEEEVLNDFNEENEIEIKLDTQLDNENLDINVDENYDSNEKEYIGKVKTKDINIKTVILNDLRSVDAKYDLIIVNQQLLSSASNFPRQVDIRVENLIKRLNIGGKLVLIERGSPLGAETITRARQIILRPENYPKQVAKIPRPFMSTLKKVQNQQDITSIDKGRDEPELELELELEPEILENFDIIEQPEKPADPIFLSVIAPCSHHGACPMQFNDPEVFLYGQIGKKLLFCNFNVDVHRPNYLLELKRGRKLATKWTYPNSAVGIKGISNQGRGREGGTDFETASFSYLIVERSNKDSADIEKLSLREKWQPQKETGYQPQNRDEYPRITGPPIKKKGFVTLNVCAPSGHIEKWNVSKSTGKQEYHDARKAKMGDLWALGKKSATQSLKENVFYKEKIATKKENLKKKAKMDLAKMQKQLRKDFKLSANAEPVSLEDHLSLMADSKSLQVMSQPKTVKIIKQKSNVKY